MMRKEKALQERERNVNSYEGPFQLCNLKKIGKENAECMTLLDYFVYQENKE